MEPSHQNPGIDTGHGQCSPSTVVSTSQCQYCLAMAQMPWSCVEALPSFNCASKMKNYNQQFNTSLIVFSYDQSTLVEWFIFRNALSIGTLIVRFMLTIVNCQNDNKKILIKNTEPSCHWLTWEELMPSYST